MAKTSIEERPTTRAVVRYIGRSPYKVRHVVALIRGKDVEEAQNILLLCERGATEEVGKLLNSAVANAEHNQQIPLEELRVKEAFVDEGPTAKRFRPRARGRGNRILKRSSHITIILERMEETAIATKAAKDSTSGAAGAREQRRRRAEASKAAAKAKQEALDAEIDETALLEGEEVEVDSDKPAKKASKKSADEAKETSGEDKPKKKTAAKKDSDTDSKPVAKKAPAKKKTEVVDDDASSERASAASDETSGSSSPEGREAASEEETSSASKKKTKKSKEEGAE
ncbi:MAG TPA: 50S ribosomal protein L22 [Acidimicrobiia bacterium]|nr:50S ribosomal protein L22 [Acidimicrobiia bacterium]